MPPELMPGMRLLRHTGEVWLAGLDGMGLDTGVERRREGEGERERESQYRYFLPFRSINHLTITPL